MSQAEPLEAAAAPPEMLRLDAADDVAVALRPLVPGETVAPGGEAGPIAVRDPIPQGHKIALRDIAAGAAIRKYGFPIGTAEFPIRAGDHVHSHNLVTALGGPLAYAFEPAEADPPAEAAPLAFRGYRRADGRVGTRNEIWILPTVGCVARTAEKIAAIANARHAASSRIDGIHAFAHPHGCSQLGEDLDSTRRILAALACHPNAGGVLLIGLGCESNQLDDLLAEIPEGLRGRVRTLGTQDVEDEMAAGLALVDALVATASLARRGDHDLGALVLGLKCGGSDGHSGLTANPLVGRIADRVVAAGGSAILTEIPEMFGAERLLLARARDEYVFGQIAALVNGFKHYFLSHGEAVSENPSPGNKEGGITTLEEKSLGAVQKAGRGRVEDVLSYGERVRRRGLSLLEAPGNDAISSTALAAAGATIILFTTGRGTPLGFPAPTVKIASNSALAARKRNWIDFDAGRIFGEGIEPVADDLAHLVAAIASGDSTAAERNGEREIAIWKRGVTL